MLNESKPQCFFPGQYIALKASGVILRVGREKGVKGERLHMFTKAHGFMGEVSGSLSVVLTLFSNPEMLRPAETCTENLVMLLSKLFLFLRRYRLVEW